MAIPCRRKRLLLDFISGQPFDPASAGVDRQLRYDSSSPQGLRGSPANRTGPGHSLGSPSQVGLRRNLLRRIIE
jgi:hypothetical protein